MTEKLCKEDHDDGTPCRMNYKIDKEESQNKMLTTQVKL